MSVHYQRHGEVGVISIANPPVNALSQAVRRGLLDALQEGIADQQAQALVVMAEGRTFIAGADIREFGKPPQAPLLPDVISQLEACPKPLVASLHGTALGGGLEVALGCHYRVASASTRVGLPEVKLGLLPGAGGTQRLPRLTGVANALDIITSGRFVEATEAHTIGILDAISDAATPLEAGLAAARAVLAGEQATRITGQLPAPDADPQATATMQAQLESSVPELFSPFRIVEAIDACTQAASLEEGLRQERALFLACMDSHQRAGLIHLFFAARSPHLVPGVENAAPFTQLALIGEHPLFDTLQQAAQRAGITLTPADANTELCLLAPGADASTCPGQAVTLALRPLPAPISAALDAAIDEHIDTDLPSTSLSLVLVEHGAFHELVNHHASALDQQRAALTLKALRASVVVTRSPGVLSTLHDAAAQAPAQGTQTALEQASLALAQQGACYRESDIDLLSVEALGYPRHSGGAHRQATLAQPASDTSSTTARNAHS
ncbi:enoyl-CoA hydratase/isomerase family protein [Halomonas sp. C22]|uniref:enoyl-CoA hydratase/isomerase family protein n=1 Tax=Halomonas sp. C22 TaxID=2580567 RepID=UPI0011A2C886|nr:enoyl-CoA hydratase/isomerase family protein [Halomonas sp. C22]